MDPEIYDDGWDADEFDDEFAEFAIEVEEPVESGISVPVMIGVVALSALAGFVGFSLIDRRLRRPNQQTPREWAHRVPRPNPRAPELPDHGLAIENDRLHVTDWNKWIPYSSHRLQRFVNEGATTASEVIARLFYGCFPDQTWPPAADSTLRPGYDEIVAAADLNLDHALRPLRVQDAGHRGIKLVED